MNLIIQKHCKWKKCSHLLDRDFWYLLQYFHFNNGSETINKLNTTIVIYKCILNINLSTLDINEVTTEIILFK